MFSDLKFFDQIMYFDIKRSLTIVNETIVFKINDPCPTYTSKVSKSTKCKCTDCNGSLFQCTFITCLIHTTGVLNTRFTQYNRLKKKTFLFYLIHSENFANNFLKLQLKQWLYRSKMFVFWAAKKYQGPRLMTLISHPRLEN